MEDEEMMAPRKKNWLRSGADYVERKWMDAERGSEFGRKILKPIRGIPADIAKGWEMKTGKAIGYMYVVERVMNVAIHLIPLAILLTYIIALIHGFPTDPNVNSLALWIFPLVILIMTAILMILGPTVFKRMTKFLIDPIPVSKMTAEDEQNMMSVFGSALGLWNLISVAVQAIAIVTLLVFIPLWLVWEGKMNTSGNFSAYWPFGVAGRSQDLANCLAALAWMSTIWGISLIAYLVGMIGYLVWFAGFIWNIVQNKNIKGWANIRLILATAKVAKLKARAGLSN